MGTFIIAALLATLAITPEFSFIMPFAVYAVIPTVVVIRIVLDVRDSMTAAEKERNWQEYLAEKYPTPRGLKLE